MNKSERKRVEGENLIIINNKNQTLRRCRCMCRYPEPDGFKVDATYTH